jgi:XapX domain-containing protein
MKIYLVSLVIGVLVGVLYALLNVRSPAPPIVALVGLFGILVGEQLPPLGTQIWRKEPFAMSWIRQVRPHMFGTLPKGEGVSRAAESRLAGIEADRQTGH